MICVKIVENSLYKVNLFDIIPTYINTKKKGSSD